MRNTVITCGCLFSSLLFSVPILHAQEDSPKKITINGSLQSDMLLFPQEDEAIGAEDYKEWGLMNTYLDINARSQYVDVGARLEYMKFPMPGFEDDFKGWGVPYFYATGRFKNITLTLGDFYDQFGNGLIFRTYQERSLGIDNALRGARLTIQPYKGINLKMLGGKQRRYFDHNDSYVWGGDAEFSIDQWSRKLQESNTYLSFGTSYVGKYEDEEMISISGTGKMLNLPKTIGAFAARAHLQKGNYSFMTEYANKSADPSSDNKYIYKNGSALLFSGSYSKRGMSILLQAKRSDNMAFRSKRVEAPASIASFINHLPAFTQQQTYALATIYPYATQIAGGEWAFQGEFGYTFKKGSFIGGKYGTKLKANISHIRAIDKVSVEPSNLPGIVSGTSKQFEYYGTDGYTSSFFKMGDEIYYQDYTLSLEKKFTSDFVLNLMYMNQYYNMGIIKGESSTAGDGGDRIVKSNLFVAEGKYQINKKLIIRSELQYLHTKQDEGDWMFGLAELSIQPHLMLTVSDMYNSGETDIHYYSASATYMYKSHRLQVGYGRTRAGYNCSGGVCRTVPASKGVQVSYNYTF
ncbi:MAG: DUF6029 family protein [Dysgonomonas sp.]